MKLVKLVYLAHGWNLAINNRPLVSEDAQAWEYGPVLPSVYHAFKQYGSGQVEDMALPGNTNFDEIDPESKGVLDSVWDAYRKHSAYQLSSITHLKDSPWDVATRSGRTIISDDIIKAHYQKLRADRKSN